MTAIKIPGTFTNVDSLNETDKNSDLDYTISAKDPLCNENLTEIDFNENIEPIEHADVDYEIIVGNESGYDSASLRLQQELNLAQYDLENDRVDDCIKHKIRAVTLSRIVYGDDWVIGKYEIELAQSYLNDKGIRYANQCEEHCKEGVRILMHTPVEIFSEEIARDFLSCLINGLFLLARSRLIMKNYKNSQMSISKALNQMEKYEKLSNISDDDVYQLKHKLMLTAGKICLKCNELDKSEHYFTTVLDLTKLNRTCDSPDLILIYHLLAQVEQLRGSLSNHQRSIEYCQNAHEISTKVFDNHSEEVIQTCWTLSNAYSLCGDIDSEKTAECYLRECLDSAIAKYGEESIQVLQYRLDVAKLLIRLDQNDDAAIELKRIRSLENVIHGEYSEESTETLQMLGSVFLSKNMPKESTKYYQSALFNEELHHGKKTATYRSIKKILTSICGTPQTDRSDSSIQIKYAK